MMVVLVLINRQKNDLIQPHMQNSVRDADCLPLLCHISPQMYRHLENTSSEVVASNRTSVYKGIASFAHADYRKNWKLQRRIPKDVFCIQ